MKTILFCLFALFAISAFADDDEVEFHIGCNDDSNPINRWFAWDEWANLVTRVNLLNNKDAEIKVCCEVVVPTGRNDVFLPDVEIEKGERRNGFDCVETVPTFDYEARQFHVNLGCGNGPKCNKARMELQKANAKITHIFDALEAFIIFDGASTIEFSRSAEIEDVGLIYAEAAAPAAKKQNSTKLKRLPSAVLNFNRETDIESAYIGVDVNNAECLGLTTSTQDDGCGWQIEGPRDWSSLEIEDSYVRTNTFERLLVETSNVEVEDSVIEVDFETPVVPAPAGKAPARKLRNGGDGESELEIEDSFIIHQHDILPPPAAKTELGVPSFSDSINVFLNGDDGATVEYDSFEEIELENNFWFNILRHIDLLPNADENTLDLESEDDFVYVQQAVAAKKL